MTGPSLLTFLLSLPIHNKSFFLINPRIASEWLGSLFSNTDFRDKYDSPTDSANYQLTNDFQRFSRKRTEKDFSRRVEEEQTGWKSAGRGAAHSKF